MRKTSIIIPTLVRIKPGALDRIGIYATRAQLKKVVILFSKELDRSLIERVSHSMLSENIEVLSCILVEKSSFEQAQEIFQTLPQQTQAIIGVGGGKALDVAKYVAFLTRLPYIACPTALSNDGFSSPQSSLDFKGSRRSFAAAMPYGVVVDTEVCLQAPKILWLAGIGDSVAKITAVYDWKLAFKHQGTQIDDFAAILSDATVFQLMAKPDHDLEGIKLLASALMLNGVAMEICGSSRPASGSEHLISHALDQINPKPYLHGLQVGVATYIVSQLQGGAGTERITKLFHQTSFWEGIKSNPFIKENWIKAFKMAETIKENFYTILSERDCVPELIHILETDENLKDLFV